MNLLNPGLGDMLDRLVILSRKIVELPGRKDFEEEHNELCRKLQFSVPPDMFARVAAINAAIWQREDEVRRLCKGTTCEAVGIVAAEIFALNDKRAVLVAEINGTEGEKLYK